MKSSDQRSEQRLDPVSAVLPFLGSRDDDYQPFQYVIQDYSQNGVRIAIPSWVQTREKLYQGDKVSLHLPYKFKGQSRNQGSIAWEEWDQNEDAQICGVALDKRFPETYPVFISLDTGQVIIDLADFKTADQLTLLVLKDCVLLKKGMLIYLNHLSAYFTRVASFTREEYALFRQSIINDIQSGLKKNLAYLNNIYLECSKLKDSDEDILSLVDIDQVRKSVESELYMDLFTSVLSLEVASRYLKALKILEKKSYNNYNTLAMIYLQAL